ncbi:FkbM family methyltransferase [Synechococcus sp. BO 8801]|uniref:FkbM family methyltransferase n=1 Tax=Synechococcus sp. BO 8801 TaxID=169670 RepID=UPI00117F83B4
MRLKSTTLPSLLKVHQLDERDYQALIMDTQGSELLVLKGAIPVLKALPFIKTEVPDFEAYTGCC